MINRRFMIVPPALPSGGHAEQLEGQVRRRPTMSESGWLANARLETL
jgi:hypothetical protein